MHNPGEVEVTHNCFLSFICSLYFFSCFVEIFVALVKSHATCNLTAFHIHDNGDFLRVCHVRHFVYSCGISFMRVWFFLTSFLIGILWMRPRCCSTVCHGVQIIYFSMINSTNTILEQFSPYFCIVKLDVACNLTKNIW